MERYNFRTTSLNNDQLNSELAKRGAQTFGSVQRKQQRLQRFIDAEEARQQERETLRVIVENERRKVFTRTQSRTADLRRQIVATATGRQGRSRFTQLLSEYLGY